VFLERIGLRVQNVMTILGSVMNLIEEIYVII
jgi:hypothetical protein